MPLTRDEQHLIHLFIDHLEEEPLNSYPEAQEHTRKEAARVKAMVLEAVELGYRPLDVDLKLDGITKHGGRLLSIEMNREVKGGRFHLYLPNVAAIFHNWQSFPKLSTEGFAWGNINAVTVEVLIKEGGLVEADANMCRLIDVAYLSHPYVEPVAEEQHDPPSPKRSRPPAIVT